MTMTRGTKVVLNIPKREGFGLGLRDVAIVSSRKKNGWLRVTVQRTGKTISVRNCPGQVTRYQMVRGPDGRPQTAKTMEKSYEELQTTVVELTATVDQQKEWLARAISIIKAYQSRYPSHDHPI